MKLDHTLDASLLKKRPKKYQIQHFYESKFFRKKLSLCTRPLLPNLGESPWGTGLPPHPTCHLVTWLPTLLIPPQLPTYFYLDLPYYSSRNFFQIFKVPWLDVCSASSILHWLELMQQWLSPPSGKSGEKCQTQSSRRKCDEDWRKRFNWKTRNTFYLPQQRV